MNNQIQPAHVSFELAKWLKEKGFECNSDYNQWILAKDKDDDSKKFICHSNELENYTYIDEDTEHNVYHCLSLPEQWQVVEWLRVNHGIWVYVLPQDKSVVDFRIDDSEYPSHSLFFSIIKYEKDCTFRELINTSDNSGKLFLHFDSQQEAYSTAFDYIQQNNLI